MVAFAVQVQWICFEVYRLGRQREVLEGQGRHVFHFGTCVAGGTEGFSALY
jgi:hypothetical protein